ncbi:hypothetical protein [Chromohalobacter nigrandesensis]|uniref:hypothetical protein n=1 Tax=Chromohalobacter nigrandesensis TaxID=119863 RepID=UPI001FF0F323|nr:hypothetical protein [Chromohalobacter nigrandesensis]MCK0743560.1 hypothetical protein [Chromohalobacter nigrandesensis]
MPSSPQRGGCQYDGHRTYAVSKDLNSDLDLEFFASPDGLTDLLQKLSDNEFHNQEELIEMIKRLHLPNYEEARLYLTEAVAQGVFEPNSKPGYPHQGQLLAVRRWTGI